MCVRIGGTDEEGVGAGGRRMRDGCGEVNAGLASKPSGSVVDGWSRWRLGSGDSDRRCGCGVGRRAEVDGESCVELAGKEGAGVAIDEATNGETEGPTKDGVDGDVVA